jgi:rhodanese-related sulfurtransferase
MASFGKRGIRLALAVAFAAACWGCEGEVLEVPDRGPCGCADPGDPDAPRAEVAADVPDAPADIPQAEVAADVPDETDATGAEDPGLPPASLGVVSPAALQAELASKDFLLINVHVPYEGQIPGTDAHLSYLDVDALAERLGAAPGAEAVLYCLTNFMSVRAGEDLVARGYRNLRYLDGGMSAWKTAGYPFEAP